MASGFGAEGYAEIAGGRQTVTTAGTAVQLSSTSTPCRYIEIQAFETNTGNIAFSNSSVAVPVASRNGQVLSPGASVGIPLSNLDKLYIDSAVNGEGVGYVYYR